MQEGSYKEKVRAEIKTAVDRFHKTEAKQVRPLKKKIIKQAKNYLQKKLSLKSASQNHVLNFYNILTINEKSIRDTRHNESFIKTHFYYKNLRKLQISQNYILAYLGDNHSLACPLQQMIARYKVDTDQRFNKIASLLEGIQKRLKSNKPEVNSSSNTQELSNKLLQDLGKSAYICKIASQKLVVSKGIMQMLGYDSQEFMIQCLKFRMPLFEGFSCQNYYQVMLKNLQNVNLLMDLLQGTIPYSTFQQLSTYTYTEKISSKNNIQYTCIMSITMPIPLVSLVKVQRIIKREDYVGCGGLQNFDAGFKKFCSEIRAKEYRVLERIITLPENKISKNIRRVATYIQKDPQNNKYP